MKVLYVGDPHVQVRNLKDSQALMDYVIELAMEQKVDNITFLGDLFHTHAVLRVEIIDFWKRAFQKIKFAKNDYQGIECRVLVGNHDQPGSKEKEQEMNALNIFQDDGSIEDNGGYRYVINSPQAIGSIAYVPYHSDEETFLKACQELYDKGATGMLIAHQTFTGAQYENGFFSEEGIDPALVPQKEIISGHIHKSQQVGKCFYPGTPKWDTMSDANQPKGLYIIEHNEDGTIKGKEFFSTEHIVTPIKSYEIKEGEELPELNPDARNYVVLEGKSAWINKAKKKLKSLAHIKVKPTDRVTRVNKENSVTLEKYLDTEFEPIQGVSKKDIKEFVSNI
jgi:DNA repair exonuclease SbcCD nuclease subunit